MMEPQHPFHFLATCFSYPENSSMDNAGAVLSMLATDLGVTPEQQIPEKLALTDLQVEYVRLFINGPGGVPAPPYASVYVNNSGLLRQQGYDEALAMYRQAGLEPDTEDDLPDHIRYELAFLGLVLDQNDHKLAAEFLKKHLCQWYPRFLERLITADPDPFYTLLARVTDLCLKQTLKEVLHEQTTFS